MRLAVLLLGLVLMAGCRRPAGPAAAPVRVAAASDLQGALDEVRAAFTARTGRPVQVSYGASGLLMRQIAQGAPYDLFLAAGPAFLDPLVRSSRVASDSRAAYAVGHLCLWTAAGAPARTVFDLLRPEVRRVALANPEHAPYGQAAQTALQRAGLYERLRPRLVFGENVRQALRYAETGHVDAALVACSLVHGDPGRSAAVPAELSGPVEQILGVVSGSDESGARALSAFLRSPAGQEILVRHGYSAVSGGVGR